MSTEHYYGILIAASLIALGFILAVAFGGSGSKRQKIKSRIDELQTLQPQSSLDEIEELFRAQGQTQKWTLASMISDSLGPIGGGEALRTLIIMGALCATIGFVVAHRFLGIGGPMLILLPMALGIGVPYLYLGRLKEQRVQQFLDAFPDAIDLIVRAVRAGIPASEAMSMAGAELPGPVAVEMGRIAEEISIGINPENAISEAAKRVRLPDFSFFAVTLILQRETGGNLAETLDGLSVILRKRREMRLKIRALTAEGRFTSKIIALLPVAVITALYFLNREYVVLLFTDPAAQIFLGAAAGMVVFGSILLNRMVNFEV